MLAVNHPNSFLDAILLCTLFDQPVYSLARGDAFKNPLVAKILSALKMLPVYRVSEGVENLEENYKTFDLCKEIFRQAGIVLIFSEGRCVNEWHLRPLKKGTARLAISSWEDGIPLVVLPVGINYSSFRSFGKNIRLFFGEPIARQDISLKESQGKAIQALNSILQKQLAPIVFEIPAPDRQQLHDSFYVPQTGAKRLLLFLPSLAGWLLHAPLYYPVKYLVKNNPYSADHYDSLMVCILWLTYPLYLLIIGVLVYLWLPGWFAAVVLITIPATAWSHLQLKKQF